MGELPTFLIYSGIVLLSAFLIGGVCYAVALRKGRDTVGWFLTGLFFNLVGLLILLLLPSLETPGQTKRCPACQKMTGWKAGTCNACGATLEIQEKDPTLKIKHPLRSCFLYVSLGIFLLLIVFGFIGYYCVPNQ